MTENTNINETPKVGDADVFISTDKVLLEIDVVHNFLKTSYWAEHIPIEIVEKAINNSHCFGVYEGKSQVGFARVVTDYVSFAYIADLFIIPEKQGRGLGKKLMTSIMNAPEFADLRRWHLITSDAQELYKQFGFNTPTKPNCHMEIRKQDIYQPKKG